MDFVFDLDGTICFKGAPVSNQIKAALLELKNKGNRVIFASARPIRDMLPVIPEEFHQDILIGGNGALIAKNKKIQSARTFSDEIIEKLERLINDYEITYLIDSEWDYAYTGPSNHPILQNVDPTLLAKRVGFEQLPSIVKVLFLTFTSEKSLIEELQQLEVTVHIHGNENIIDLSPTGIHKWHALQTIGVKENEFIAFGNDANDITMFQHAKKAIMIGENEQLAPFATDYISLEAAEEQVIRKISALI